MPKHPAIAPSKPPRTVNLPRLETLGDAIFAFALTLLALDLRLPDISADAIGPAILGLLPKLAIFAFAFLAISQEWDVHQRTMLHVARADGIFVWVYVLSLMFVVLLPASGDILGRFPLNPLALVFFGINLILLCLTSWLAWKYASHNKRLLDEDIQLVHIKMIGLLWLYLPIIIAVTMPLGFLSVIPVYIIWLLLPIISYSYPFIVTREKRKTRLAKAG
jgi:uncharacterized membrane protein